MTCDMIGVCRKKEEGVSADYFSFNCCGDGKHCQYKRSMSGLWDSMKSDLYKSQRELRSVSGDLDSLSENIDSLSELWDELVEEME